MLASMRREGNRSRDPEMTKEKRKDRSREFLVSRRRLKSTVI